MRNFDEMSRMFEQMDRMFDGMWMTRPIDERWSDRTLDAHPTNSMLEGRTTDRPESTTNLHEEDDAFVFVMDLPGYERDEIDLTFHDGHLRIAAVTETSDESETSYVRSSRSTHETVSIPGEVDVEGIDASYRNGVLEVTLPIVAGSDDRGHDIDIQ